MKKNLSLFSIFLFLCCLFGTAQAQVNFKIEQGTFADKYIPASLMKMLPRSTQLNNGLPRWDQETMNPQSWGPYVPKVYHYQDLAFFCKLEVKMEKGANLPIKVRLGDIDYVDYLEGKRRTFD